MIDEKYVVIPVDLLIGVCDGLSKSQLGLLVESLVDYLKGQPKIDENEDPIVYKRLMTLLFDIKLVDGADYMVEDNP